LDDATELPIDDRLRLISALEIAVPAYRAQTQGETLLGRSPPAQTVLSPLTTEISRCAAYRAVAGHVLFSANSGIIIEAGGLARDLLSRGEFQIPAAVDWLLQLLTTRDTKGLFKAAIWGVTIDDSMALPNGAHLIPFSAMPPSAMKGRIEERARELHNNWAWLSQTYFAMPFTAYVLELDDFPYIRAANDAFTRFDEAEAISRDCWAEIEAISVGTPLAIGYWFEYENQDLDYVAWENAVAWSFPEIIPKIRQPGALSNSVADQLGRFSTLPGKLRTRLRRSMKRFTLSQCRHEEMDQVLDLALAFEIAVSEEGDNAPPSMKVAVRTAQMIGGPPATRQEIRETIDALYKLRNRATHGGSSKPTERVTQMEILARSSAIYRKLLLGFLEFGTIPRWKLLELEARKLD
jgi:hypothetical protein